MVRVVGRGFVSIAEVHAIVARAHLAQSDPEMARDRFGFLERHGASMTSPLLSRFAPRAGLVTLRQTFVCRCQNYALQSITLRRGSALLVSPSCNHDDSNSRTPTSDGMTRARMIKISWQLV